MPAEKNPVMPQPNLQGDKKRMNKALLYVLAIFVFALITYLYFSPMISGDKVVYQGDIVQFKGMSKELLDYRERTGEQAFWTNSMFGGMPSFTVYTLYNGNLLNYVHNILTLGFPHPSGLLFLSMVSFFILLVVLKVDPLIAIAASVASGLSSFNLILMEAGHNSEMDAIAYMPLVVAGVLLAFQNKYIWGGLLTAVGLSLEMRANHIQVTYYLMLLLLVLGVIELVRAIREKNLPPFFKATAALVIAIVFGVATNAGYLMSMQEYSPSTIRGPSELSSNQQSSGGLDEDYAFDWSYGKMETFTILIPNFYGGASNTQLSTNSKTAEFLQSQGVKGNQLDNYLRGMPTYWGDVQFTSGPVYMGAIICFLFVLGLFVLKGKIKWWLLAATILSIMLAWGRNFYFFNDIIFHYFPMYNKFRTVTMSLVILQVTFPLMAALVLWKIIKGDIDKEKISKQLLYSLYITGGLCLFFAVAGSSLMDFVKPVRNSDPGDSSLPEAFRSALIADRKKMLQMDSLRSLLFIACMFGALWFYTKQKISTMVLGLITIGIIFIDQFPVGKRYLGSDDFVPAQQYMQNFQMSNADKAILQDKTPDYRVLNYTRNPFQDASTSYYHKSIGGYNAAKLRRYQDLVEHQFSRSDAAGKNIGPNMEVINMLNTKYIIVPDKNKQPQAQPNPNANGNAWFVSNIQWVNNADEEMAALNDLDSKETAVIDKRFEKDLSGFTPEADSTASIQLKSYEPNHLVYETNTSVPGLAVFSEIYYQPGWKSFIDGKEVAHVRADYVLRAMPVSAGSHTVEFKFHPDTYFKGESIARISSVVLLIIAAIAIVRDILMRRKVKTTA